MISVSKNDSRRSVCNLGGSHPFNCGSSANRHEDRGLNGNTIHIKDYEQVKLKDIQFALSNNTFKETMNYWTVPFYDTKEDKVSVIVWNNKDDKPINVNFIINNDILNE